MGFSCGCLWHKQAGGTTGRGVRKALRIIFVSPHTIAIRRAMGLCPALRCFGSVLSHAEHPDPPHPPKQT